MSDTAPSAEDNHAPNNGDNTDAASDNSNARSFSVVRYGLMGHLGEFSHSLDSPPTHGTKVVIRTERGVELGEVVAAVDAEKDARSICRRKLEDYLDQAGSDYPFKRGGKILRKANQQDIIDQRHLNESAHEEAAFCRDQIRRLNLAMKLVAVEHLLGGERIVFYFSSETRVDFRELVRRLAGQYRTRIEMRQVGARDEARLVGDYERCGRQCCCRQFLKHLQPVAMKMAKLQKATLDPSKISGRCGRLMCCLRFEDAGYEDLRKHLPRRNTWVRTEQVVGRVVDTQILTQLVMLQTPEGTQVAVGNEDIVERNIQPPKPGQAPPARGREQPREGSKPQPVSESPGGGDGDGNEKASPAQPAESGEQAPGDTDKGGKSGKDSGKSSKKRRMRGGRKRGSKSKAKSKSGSGKKSGGSRRSRRSKGKNKPRGKGGGKG